MIINYGQVAYHKTQIITVTYITSQHQILLLKCELQELIVTFLVMHQMRCFWYGFKDEDFRIPMVQFSMKNIKLLQFCS